MVKIKSSHAKLVIVALDTSTYYKTTNVRIQAKNPSNVRFATSGLPVTTILRLICGYIPVKNLTVVPTVTANLYKWQTYVGIYAFTLENVPTNVRSA